ncbi:proline dehydrogenase family protein [Shimazuella sp. AN120528]|uniref:proline dehydrogenase family protein n=1 Tax=Shimazuella soli TaxID=1892854 RepID=UPI001F0ED39D|nr:proline dehydrogenase family protein [Shimazuella soli]MCH5586504.1 proline dehydrogenase family protein [Shimazuella soli]
MSFARKVVLSLAANPVIRSIAGKYGLKLGAGRFVAGETLQEAITRAGELNEQNLWVTLDHLGESVTSKEEAIEATRVAVDTYSAIYAAGLTKTNVSVKLTQLGLDIDSAFCLENMKKIAAKAKETHNFLRIDMEDTPRIEITMDIFQTLLSEYGSATIGLVIQSYLYRSEQDVAQLGKQGVNLRIVKGAYKEPKEVAFPAKKDVDEQFIQLVKQHLTNGAYTAIATHDENMIYPLLAWIKEQNIADHLYEFQMLYGIRTDLARKLVAEGYKVRVYTPFGKQWYPYFTRRLAERPANALFILKNLFKK